MATITLTKGYVAVVDDEDADLSDTGFYATINSLKGHVYAKRTVIGSRPKRCEYLHRLIAARMGPIPDGYVVDHIDGDTLNCRRANLRAVTHKTNIWNRSAANKNSRSGVPGVRFRPKTGKWQAYVCPGGKMKTVGTFPTMEDARVAREAYVRNLAA